MESRENREPVSHEPGQDTSHLSAPAKSGTKSKKPLVLLLVVVLVGAAVAGGLYLYKVNVLDPQAKEAAMKSAVKPSPSPKRLKPEEVMNKVLIDAASKEIEELKKGDDSTAVKNSTQAALSVGGNIDVSSLEKYKD